MYTYCTPLTLKFTGTGKKAELHQRRNFTERPSQFGYDNLPKKKKLKMYRSYFNDCFDDVNVIRNNRGQQVEF